MCDVSASGTITNVQAKFAFISSDKGTIFCPLAAAVDSDEFVGDMRNKYSIGDVVHFKAIQQPDKNGCRLRATQARLSTKSTSYQGLGETDSIRAGIGQVTLVQETLAYALSDELGSVFVPGSVFTSNASNRLNAVLSEGTMLMMDVTRQTSRNDCMWRATNAAVFNISAPQRGSGVITSMTELAATVTSREWGTVRCSILAWSGGSQGRGESLFDVVSFGEEVEFELIPSNGASAVRWSSPRLGGLSDSSRLFSSASEISTQTGISAEAMFFRSLSQPNKESVLNQIPFIHRLLNEIYQWL